MNKLYIEGTETKPTFDFDPEGDLKVFGKALPEDAKKLFAPVFEWINNCTSEEIVFDVNLYYFNTAVSKQLFDMFNLAVTNKNVKKVTVKWRYEEGDDDTLESGKIYRDELRDIDFEFYEYAEI